MCGIAGILGPERAGDEAVIAAMTGVMLHRGPDAGGSISLTEATLGHRRLTIIDLSDGGLQPMQGPSGAWLVTNGEIYNYRELRQELSAAYQFKTSSDTEVLLAVLELYGLEGLDRVNGMFAFCYYDPGTRKAILARDRFGQKPLFYAEHGGRLHFASEVKGLLAAGVRAEPNTAAWSRYLGMASYDDMNDSFFAGVFQLMPGEYATYSPKDGMRVGRYYDVAECIRNSEMSAGRAAEDVRALLIDAARLHMRADVPVGVSLSGGLDSSALLAALDLAGELTDSVACISVDFGGALSEREWIEAAAEYHGLSSRTFGYDPAGFQADISPLMWHLEAPIGGLMNCALTAVMSAARASGIKVLQDGTGLDEAFAGYRNHHNLYVGLLERSGDPGYETAVKEYASNWDTTPEATRAAGRAALVDTVTAIDGTIPVRPDLLAAGFFDPVAAQDNVAATDGTDALRAGLIDYLQVRKIPRNTRMKDRLSMGFGLELRLPFLDHRLVEYALSMPHAFYFLHGRSKSIVREALAGAMDEKVRTAKKRSIQAPQGPWLRQEPMRSYVGDLIHSRSFRERDVFDAGKVAGAFDHFCEQGADNSFFVWQWINVEEWYRTFVDHSAPTRVNPVCSDFYTETTRANPDCISQFAPV